MDSISQIVLGAAVGEAVLGKKIGNRAMLWGAIAGTIPDLDVVSNLWLSEVEGLAAHRGISHSIFFSIIGAFVIGYAVHWIYQSKFHYQIAIAARSLLFLALGVGGVYVSTVEGFRLLPMLLTLAVLAGGYFFIKQRYFHHRIEKPNASRTDWILLFFLGLFTHPILDCFTVYGTQLFAPFSNYRVAWATISVADPLYTIPFLACLIIASFYNRESRFRSIINWIGIGWSILYLSFTVLNKQSIISTFSKDFTAQGIEYQELLVSPTILNNVLWHGVAKTDTSVIFGKYSWFDSDDRIQTFNLPTGDNLIASYSDDPTLQTLKWFSDGFYHVLQRGDTLQFNDMRYGKFLDNKDDPANFIFKFDLVDREGILEMLDAQGGPPPGEETSFMGDLVDRIRGIE